MLDIFMFNKDTIWSFGVLNYNLLWKARDVLNWGLTKTKHFLVSALWILSFCHLTGEKRHISWFWWVLGTISSNPFMVWSLVLVSFLIQALIGIKLNTAGESFEGQRSSVCIAIFVLYSILWKLSLLSLPTL